MERSYFFDSTETEQRIYQAADFARFHAQIVGNGVSNTASLPDLSVEAKQNMTVSLGAGYCFINGYMYENTSSLDLTHDVAHTTHDRIDRIVIRFDNTPTERRIYAVIKKGNPAENPVAPSLQRDGYVYELSVARVLITAGKSFIGQSQIMDERTNDAVCGFIPLHNIYRGLQINEVGMVSMPNQSFVKAYSTGLSVSFPAGQETTITIPKIEEDHQNEMSGNFFIPKTSGVYDLYIEVGFPTGHVPSNTDMHIHVYKDNVRSFPVAARTLGGYDNFIFGTGVDKFEAGQKVDLRLKVFGSTSATANLIRFRVAKIS